jgi:winged helix DNA-binding protein
VRDLDIARWRLRTQRLTGPPAASADDAVGSLLAVQAENPSQAAWAVAARTSDPDPADLAALIDSGAVVRTHVLRPTWHFARADDIGWLIDLTAPRLRQVTSRALSDPHGMDGPAVTAALTTITTILDRCGPLTRTQLAAELRPHGIEGGQRLMMLLMHAELEALICSGPVAGQEHTYALMGQRVPGARRPGRAEALAEIALRYFTGHGPATERDLAYWASLTVTDVRAGLAQVRDQLGSFGHEGRTFWHAPGQEPPAGPGQPAGHLLQILDETYRGYQDSRWVLDTAGHVPRGRETALGMALTGAQLVASMKRTVTAGQVRFDLRPYGPLEPAQVSALEDAARRYGEFLGLEPRLTGARSAPG